MLFALKLKLKYPTQPHLIRGNHEARRRGRALLAGKAPRARARSAELEGARWQSAGLGATLSTVAL